MRGVPTTGMNIKVWITDGKNSRNLKPADAKTTVDRLNHELVVEILSPDLLAAIDYLAQPEVAKAPSLESVVRGWVR